MLKRKGVVIKAISNDNNNYENDLKDAWDEAWRGFYQGYVVPDTAREITRADICDHEYKQYVGLTESYEYCIHCDIKKVVE